ncbi:MAG: metal-sensitive transcriptional regulator [Myxococcota bacterium]
MLTGDEKKKMLARLKRIEGQVAGIHRMVESETYCVEVLHQFSAVQGALSKAAQVMLSAHLESCVHEAIIEGAESERRAKLEELVELFRRFGRVVGK